MTIRSDESEIRGGWYLRAGRIEADDACRRIEQLIREVLRKVAQDPSGWEVLYVDPTDGRFWELTYPESQQHGGGPPRLKQLTAEAARMKYGDL